MKWILQANLFNFDECVDNSSEKYCDVLSTCNATFYSTRSSFNVVIIDEEKKSWSKITRELKINADAISAIFVRENEFQEFTSHWARSPVKEVPVRVQRDVSLLTSNGCTLLSPSTYQFRLAGVKTGLEPNKLSEVISAAKEAGCLLVIRFTSIDQVLDAIATARLPIKQMALLSPASDKSLSYIEKWSSSELISIGHYRSQVPEGML